MKSLTNAISILGLLTLAVPGQAAITKTMHKYEPPSSRSGSGPPVVANLGLIKRYEESQRQPDSNLDERAFHLTLKAQSTTLDKRQEEPTHVVGSQTASSASASTSLTTNNDSPYAFPSGGNSNTQSSYSDPYAPSTTSQTYYQPTSYPNEPYNTLTASPSWSSFWTSPGIQGDAAIATSAANPTETFDTATNGTGYFVPNGTNNDDQPITDIDAEDSSRIGTIYTIDVDVDGVQLPVHVDTGSTQFWAAHSSCERCKQNGMTTINTTLPSWCYDNIVNTTYAVGWVVGCQVNVSLTLGEDTLQNYSILAVIDAANETVELGGFYSGLIGLGSDGANHYPTVVSALYKQGAIQQPIVGFYLPRAGENRESEITFGDPATSEHADGSRVVYLPRQGGNGEHYVVRMDSLKVGSEDISNGADCYLDTGSSGIAVPQDKLKVIFQAAYGTTPPPNPNDPVTVPCQAPPSNTGVWVTFGGMAFEIPYQDLIYHDSDGTCGPYISSYAGPVSDIWLFGDAFFHNVYHSVNVETGEVEMFGLKY